MIVGNGKEGVEGGPQCICNEIVKDWGTEECVPLLKCRQLPSSGACYVRMGSLSPDLLIVISGLGLDPLPLSHTPRIFLLEEKW